MDTTRDSLQEVTAVISLESQIVEQVYADYSRSARRMGVQPRQHAQSLSGVERHNNEDYVVLRSNYSILAVYHLPRGGAPRQVERWPDTINEYM